MWRAFVNGVTCISVCSSLLWTRPATAEEDGLTVRNPKHLPDRFPVERVPIGVAGDYKPCVVRMPSGDLRVVAFHGHGLEGGKIREDMLLFRSRDGGKTWTDAETLPLLGREPYFSLTDSGVLFITTHLLARDVRNKLGYIHSYVHRSADRGKTWQTTAITADDVPGSSPEPWVHTSRNVLGLTDGTLILGVSLGGVGDYLWRSKDGGKTWDRSLKCKFDRVDAAKLWWPFMAETVFRQARNGDLLAVFRVDSKVFPRIPGTDVPQETSDQYERMVLYRSKDGGASWSFSELGSHYGEMYPAVLALGDGRLLFTFTMRTAVSPNRPPLGVRAVVGKETRDGFAFDFRQDRIVISNKTPVGASSGGGFGPTVRLSDGTLVTACSYRGPDNQTHLEVARWRLPASGRAGQ